MKGLCHKQYLLAMQVVVHVMGSFQVYSMPVFDMIETQLVKRGISNGLPTRLIYRSAYVIIVAFVGITLPFFGDLLGFIGEPCYTCQASIAWTVLPASML